MKIFHVLQISSLINNSLSIKFALKIGITCKHGRSCCDNSPRQKAQLKCSGVRLTLGDFENVRELGTRPSGKAR